MVGTPTGYDGGSCRGRPQVSRSRAFSLAAGRLCRARGPPREEQLPNRPDKAREAVVMRRGEDDTGQACGPAQVTTTNYP